jgi:AcrR family transcriptional regulator
MKPPGPRTEPTKPVPRLPKRERTRRQIISAAIEVMAERGLAQFAVQEIADRAEVTTGTFYNHFRDKADIVEAVAIRFSSEMMDAAEERRRTLASGSERLVDGCRRYLSIAREAPSTALLVLELAIASPRMLETIGEFVLADVRRGVRQKEFRIFGEQAAVDLVHGYIMLAMRQIALRPMPAAYDRVVVATILQGLGLSFERATALASLK